MNSKTEAITSLCQYPPMYNELGANTCLFLIIHDET